AGVFSSCCLALDSSSSFPCPAFRAIAKSETAGPFHAFKSPNEKSEQSQHQDRKVQLQRKRGLGPEAYTIGAIDCKKN
ncbi:hypothetical protein STEG23_014762, partial [Scotinomys teguina]